MQLYNTLSRALETVQPSTNSTVGMYACGLTVYDYTHLGHLRKYTMDDVLIKMLRHEGCVVTFVQNITDVGHLASDADTGEDKLEKGALKYHKSVWEVAQEFETYFWESMDAMGNERPDVSCRATEHIPAQLELVKKLEKKGFAYLIEGDGVYFDTSKVADYGKLAHLDLEHLQEGARVEVVAGKRNPTDFALWKFERPGENRAMVWESPWHPRSFPGWHVECSAMSMQYLGEQFEIHTGGIDHIPVHHTNEIAQSEAATGKKPFVKIWVHHNFLRVAGEKMSKSLGNFYTIDDVQAKGFSPQALRLLFLSTHYRSELNFTWENLAGMQKAWERLKKQINGIARGKHSQQTKLSPAAQELSERFWRHMRRDLATPEATATLWEVLKASLTDEEKWQLLQDFDVVLGLQFSTVLQENQTEQSVTPVPKAVVALLEEREAARAAHDFQTADLLRNSIAAAGYLVQDTKTGQVLSPLASE